MNVVFCFIGKALEKRRKKTSNTTNNNSNNNRARPTNICSYLVFEWTNWIRIHHFSALIFFALCVFACVLKSMQFIQIERVRKNHNNMEENCFSFFASSIRSLKVSVQNVCGQSLRQTYDLICNNLLLFIERAKEEKKKLMKKCWKKRTNDSNPQHNEICESPYCRLWRTLAIRVCSSREKKTAQLRLYD